MGRRSVGATCVHITIDSWVVGPRGSPLLVFMLEMFHLNKKGVNGMKDKLRNPLRLRCWLRLSPQRPPPLPQENSWSIEHLFFHIFLTFPRFIFNMFAYCLINLASFIFPLYPPGKTCPSCGLSDPFSVASLDQGVLITAPGLNLSCLAWAWTCLLKAQLPISLTPGSLFLTQISPKTMNL